ncbi:MAG: EAL domain-containing protein [Enterobacterales bacterium]|nr:EAL domain-containing protein [Enterobacterales bacterium]
MIRRQLLEIYLLLALIFLLAFWLVLDFTSNASQMSSLYNTKTLLIVGSALVVIGCYAFCRLRWIMRLEDYAWHLLASEGHFPIKTKHTFDNVISHALNQLILNNSQLTKEKLDLAEQIRKTSYIDSTTELGNQLFFKAELQVRLHNHDEAESGLVAILSFVDDLNQQQRQLSDDQEVKIASILKSFVENNDMAVVARLKESEFGLILPNFTADQTDQFCRRLIDRLTKGVFGSTADVEHFIDIGISTYKQGFGYYNIMAEADMALRNAQLQGCNNWFIYGEPLARNKSKGSLRWRSFLQGVLQRQEIILFTQQLHYFSDQAFDHQEILARIPDGQSILDANTFIAMANQCGLAAEFDRQIIENLLDYLLYQQNSDQKPLYTVNLLSASLLDPIFSQWLVNRLKNHPQIAKQLVFEVSESRLSRCVDEFRPLMEQLHQLGIRWCVEHFGSPDRDWSYLGAIPVDMIKVDRRIINNIANESEQQLLLSSILASFAPRKMLIFAEGVEKEQDAEYLRKHHLAGAQGYFYSQPQKLKFDKKQLKAV